MEKAAKRNPYGLHFFTFFPPDKSSCPHCSFLCPQPYSSTSLIFLTPSIDTSEWPVSILPFLRTNQPSARHSDPFQNFHRHMYIHMYNQNKLKSRGNQVPYCTCKSGYENQAAKTRGNNIAVSFDSAYWMANVSKVELELWERSRSTSSEVS